MTLTIRDPEFRQRVSRCHAEQRLLTELAIGLDSIEPGKVILSMPFDARFTQQNGYLHAGVVTTLADAACGFAALSLMEPDQDVLSVEFKLNLMSPGVGQRFIATGTVLRPGRTLTVTSGVVLAKQNEKDPGKEIARFQGTMIAVGPGS